MSTSTPTTDRTDYPTLTDDTWRDETTETTPDTPLRGAQHQFSADCEIRLYNLIDEENRAML